jgi:cytochrome b pre-mRNA-processing protein 3
MLSRLLQLFPARSLAAQQAAARKAGGEALFDALSRASRRPAFYAALGVPDTIDGRFDLLALHAVLAFRALQAHGAEGRGLAQATCDRMFESFDDAVRALGVGDMGVPRKVKTMAGAYQGRAAVYGPALDASDDAALATALARNVFRSADDPRGHALARYALAAAAALAAQPLDAYSSGAVQFPDPPEARAS